MCFHKSNTKSKEELEKRFKAAFDDFSHVPVFHDNGFDHGRSAVITMENPHQFKGLSWGLVPHWAKDRSAAMGLRLKTLNAKSETALELPSFKKPMLSSRCLVVADGFFEWMDYKGKKYPHYISLKGRTAFAMAGISDIWVDKGTGELLETFSILTCEANPLMGRIHNLKKRMPVILNKAHEQSWLDPGLSENDIKSFLKPYDEKLMEAYTVSKLVNDKEGNLIEVLEPYSYQELSYVQGTLF
jgi:putative SOS response-associated peptidase YedK